MRTALVFSALLIVDAINNYKPYMNMYSEDTLIFVSKVVFVFLVVDIIEFFVNLIKRSN